MSFAHLQIEFRAWLLRLRQITGAALAFACANVASAQYVPSSAAEVYPLPHVAELRSTFVTQVSAQEPATQEKATPAPSRIHLAQPPRSLDLSLAPPPPPTTPERVKAPQAQPEAAPRGLRLPPELPGALAPPLKLSPYDPGNPKARQRNIDQLFPSAPPLPPDLLPPPGANGRPMELLELENLALAANPAMRQAQAAVTAARGNAIQVGTHPNPVMGYEGDTVGSGGTANYHGGYVQQLIKTAGKLHLAQAAASMDIRKAELNLRKTRITVITQVQSRYYAVLVAQEAVRATHALAAFTNEAYRVQVEQLRGGEAAPYEPMQLRVLANQAQGALIQARNRYFSAWKQLAAGAGVPDMPPIQLAGTLDVAAPPLRFDIAWNRVLQRHTDIESARFGETQARLNLRVEEVTPVPDLVFYAAVQKDFTSNPFGTTFNMQAGLPLPIYDRNTGDIMRTQGELQKASLEATRVRNELTAVAADAFERYENNRVLLELYRVQILPDQARVYRGVYERHQQQPDRVSFGDVIVAQQTLASTITVYLTVLGAQWQAVADLSAVCQVEDLSELQTLGSADLPPVPEPPPADAK
ncbi:MAG: TolC family protein [Planctomycetes bacterium]|nr:TolC family protein [Planctomycetota bacterium]